MHHNLLALSLSVSILATSGLCVAQPTVDDGYASPLAITPSQRQYLSRLARRTMHDAALGLDMHEPGYVPAKLRSKKAEAVVRVREGGFLLAETSGGSAPLAKAVRDAAQNAAEVIQKRFSDFDVSRLNQMLIEIEVIGPTSPIAVNEDWTKPRAIDPFVEPGIHGILLLAPEIQTQFCPSEIFTNDLTVAGALERIAHTVLSDMSQISRTRLYRFRTDHWYQSSSGADVVALCRGLTLVEPEAVTRSEIDAAIDRLARYLRYRQLPNGLFSYRYEAGHDTYSPEDNLVRQIGGALALALHAKWSGSDQSREAANKAIQFHLQGLRPIAGVAGASFVETADGQNKLGVTALLSLTLSAYPDAAKYREINRRLVSGMLWLQRPSGMFITAFPPAARVDAQDYFPGEALLALSTDYANHPTSQGLEAFDRAIRFYRSYFHKLPSPAIMPWQVQAYAQMAKQSKREDYAAYVFELTDFLVDKQLTPANCHWPDMYGGIAAYQPGRAGISTASYLEGFTAALTLARDTGDAKRSARYERTVRLAARFVMQLEVRPVEAYFVHSPRDAIGGMRTTPSLNLLRIDHVQHALIALMKTRQVLFGRPN